MILNNGRKNTETEIRFFWLVLARRTVFDFKTEWINDFAGPNFACHPIHSFGVYTIMPKEPSEHFR